LTPISYGKPLSENLKKNSAPFTHQFYIISLYSINESDPVLVLIAMMPGFVINKFPSVVFSKGIMLLILRELIEGISGL